jgi:general stress protein 26
MGFLGDLMKNVRKEAADVIRACDFAFVSTINLENFPETRVLLNSLNRRIDEKLDIYFASGNDSPKFEQLKRNSNASLYYYVGFTASDSMKNMILFGNFEIVTDKAIKDALWSDDFLEYYKDGKEDEQYGILKFISTGYKYYCHENGTPKKCEGKF